jgi:hypothetical protein
MPEAALQDLPLFVHRDENNHDSRRHLEENRDKFSRQCALVYSLLKSGVRLTMKSAINEYGIGDIRRRIKDLRDICGVEDIKDRWVKIEDKTRYKEWWI